MRVDRCGCKKLAFESFVEALLSQWAECCIFLHRDRGKHRALRQSSQKMPRSKIVQLASLILQNTEKIDEHYSSQQLPTPSFDVDQPLKVNLPDEIVAARDSIFDASTELQELLQGPVGIIQQTTAFVCSLKTVD